MHLLARHCGRRLTRSSNGQLEPYPARMEGEAWSRPAAAVQTCCCLTARCGLVVRPHAPLLGWRVRGGLLRSPSHCQQSRPLRYQRAPVAAAAGAATGTRRASTSTTSTRRQPKDGKGDFAEDAALTEVGEEEDRGEGDRHAAEASLRGGQQRGAARARSNKKAGPSAEVKMPWLDMQWLESLHAQQAELDRVQAATKLGTTAEDVRTCWAVVVEPTHYSSKSTVLRVVKRAS